MSVLASLTVCCERKSVTVEGIAGSVAVSLMCCKGKSVTVEDTAESLAARLMVC